MARRKYQIQKTKPAAFSLQGSDVPFTNTQRDTLKSELGRRLPVAQLSHCRKLQ